ncbi:MAG TPA: non-ribosomal peptide synthetase [Streptosporangiaceae bacterium]|nr:non-ribosomal peptide synthetase [Streptosporangiaceae bacterium]
MTVSTRSATSTLTACPVVAAFEDRVDTGPDRPAVVLASGTVSYRELDARANAVAAILLDRRGEGPEPVPLMVRDPAWMLAACMGVLKAGKFYVPVNPHHPAPRNREILRQLGATLVVTDDPAPAHAAGGRSHVEVGGLGGSAAGSGRPRLAISADQWAYVLYTSGSTGTPKGIVQTRTDMRQNVDRHEALGIGPGDRVTLISADGFIAAISNVYIALVNGAALVPHSFQHDGVMDIGARLERAGVTIYYSFPSFLRQAGTAADTAVPVPGVRLAYLGGEPVHASDVALARRLLGEVTVAVGLNSTETGLTRLYLVRPGDDIPDPVPVGGPVPGVAVRVLDEAGAPVPPGGAGQIAVRSAYVRPALWTDEGPRPLTEQVDGVAEFRSGDRGYLDPSGSLVHLGRGDGMVKVRGYRVETVEVEARVTAVPGVGEAVVVPYDAPEDGGTELAAYVVCTDPALTAATIRQQLAVDLPTPWVPASVVLMPGLPRTRNGKVDRKALPSPVAGRTAVPHEAAPQPAETAALERAALVTSRVAQIWGEVLGVTNVAPDDDFFSLGGTSISALRVISRVRNEFEVRVPLAVIFETPSVVALAEAVLSALP